MLVDFLLEILMSRISKSDRIQLWLDRLSRFSAMNRSVADFCAAEECLVASFYQWRRRLSPQVRQPRRSQAGRQRPRSASAFAELALVNPLALAAAIELPNGVEIKLGSEASTVRVIVAEVLKHFSDTAQEPTSC